MNGQDFEEIASMCVLMGFRGRSMIPTLPGDKISKLDMAYLLEGDYGSVEFVCGRNAMAGMSANVVFKREQDGHTIAMENMSYDDKEEAIAQIKKQATYARTGHEPEGSEDFDGGTVFDGLR